VAERLAQEVTEKARKEKVPVEPAGMQHALCCCCSAAEAVQRQRATVEAAHVVAAHERGRHCHSLLLQSLNYHPPWARTVQSVQLQRMTTAEEVFSMVDCCRQEAVGAI
jgi:hypothetical protein